MKSLFKCLPYLPETLILIHPRYKAITDTTCSSCTKLRLNERANKVWHGVMVTRASRTKRELPLYRVTPSRTLSSPCLVDLFMADRTAWLMGILLVAAEPRKILWRPSNAPPL